MEAISKDQLIEGLNRLHASQKAFVTVEVECSDNAIYKTCPFHDDVVKISTITGRIPSKTDPSGTYENAVNRQRGREGNEEQFTALPANYEWFKGPFVKYRNDGELGLPLIVSSRSSIWKRASTGEELTPEEVAEWTKKKTFSKSRQETEKPVIWSVPKVKNIIGINAACMKLEVK